jgi:hypothetical protein
MKPVVWILLIAMLVLHHDWWFWDDATLVFDWCPIGLFYQVVLSAVAGLFWLFVVTCHWPSDLAASDAESIASDSDQGGAE